MYCQTNKKYNVNIHGLFLKTIDLISDRNNSQHSLKMIRFSLESV